MRSVRLQSEELRLEVRRKMTYLDALVNHMKIILMFPNKCYPLKLMLVSVRLSTKTFLQEANLVFEV